MVSMSVVSVSMMSVVAVMVSDVNLVSMGDVVRGTSRQT